MLRPFGSTLFSERTDRDIQTGRAATAGPAACPWQRQPSSSGLCSSTLPASCGGGRDGSGWSSAAAPLRRFWREAVLVAPSAFPSLCTSRLLSDGPWRTEALLCLRLLRTGAGCPGEGARAEAGWRSSRAVWASRQPTLVVCSEATVVLEKPCHLLPGPAELPRDTVAWTVPGAPPFP